MTPVPHVADLLLVGFHVWVLEQQEQVGVLEALEDLQVAGGGDVAGEVGEADDLAVDVQVVGVDGLVVVGELVEL